LVSAQVILLVIGVIGFFATGGIGKVKKAREIAQTDFNLIKERLNQSDFVNDIKEKTKSGMEGKEA
jgi:hypothetical protein